MYIWCECVCVGVRGGKRRGSKLRVEENRRGSSSSNMRAEMRQKERESNESRRWVWVVVERKCECVRMCAVWGELAGDHVLIKPSSMKALEAPGGTIYKKE